MKYYIIHWYNFDPTKEAPQATINPEWKEGMSEWIKWEIIIPDLIEFISIHGNCLVKPSVNQWTICITNKSGKFGQV